MIDNRRHCQSEFQWCVIFNGSALRPLAEQEDNQWAGAPLL